MKKLRIAGVLLHHPFGYREAVPPARARQVEDEIRVLVEAMLAANGLNVVTIQDPPAKPRIQLTQ